jgi:hypothetical protein
MTKPKTYENLKVKKDSVFLQLKNGVELHVVTRNNVIDITLFGNVLQIPVSFTNFLGASSEIQKIEIPVTKEQKKGIKNIPSDIPIAEYGTGC